MSGAGAGQPVGHGRGLRLAHRGDHRNALENSLAAFRAALAVPGCDGLEFDVRLAADGVPVVVHDATLLRVLGRPDAVADLKAVELHRLGVPSLAAVLEATPRDAFLDVELKLDGGEAFVRVLRDARGAGGALERAVVSSFDLAALATAGRLEPGWERWLNAEDLTAATIATARRLGCDGVSVDWRAIDEAGMVAARAAGLVVAAWTVTSVKVCARLDALGVAAQCVEGEALVGREAAAIRPAERQAG